MLINTLDEVVRLLDQGNVVAVPTESSFAFAARLDRAEAMRALAALKPGRKSPIGLVVGDAKQIEPYVLDISTRAKNLMRQFWPGPLSIIFAASPLVPDLVTAGTASVAIRVPDDSLLQSLLAACQTPLTATSANRTGEEPICSIRKLGEVFPELPVWNAVPETPGGLASTIVDPRFDPVRLIRAGAVDINSPAKTRPRKK